MSELEKILQEIEEEIQMKKMVWESLKKPPYNDFEQSLWIAGMRNAKEIIEKYLDKNDGWIPVEERLPEVPEDIEDEDCPEFNVTIKGASESTTLKYSSDGTWFDDNGIVYPVAAWQPLPEPYKPKEGE